MFFCPFRGCCPREPGWSQGGWAISPSCPCSFLLLVLRNSPVASFSFLRKTDIVESPLFCCCDNKWVCVFPAPPPSSMEGAEKMQSDFLPQCAYFFFNQKCCFVLIRCPLPRKKNLLLDWQLPQTLNKRIKENCLGCLALLEALSIMCELQCVTIFYSNTNVSPGAFESGKQNSYFNPNSICIAQMITSHLSKLPSLVGSLTFSSNSLVP